MIAAARAVPSAHAWVREDALWMCAILLVAMALRVAGAQGGLWLDEAWSATLANDVGTPLGVFVSVNHDNNHHLNSLWLQFVGFDAAPPLTRALSIASGTLSVLVATLIALPRGRGVAGVTALLFAISPVLVTLGSEARGYAPMALAFLVAVLIVDRSLTGTPVWRPRAALALAFGLGALSQLTIVFGISAIIGWYGSVMIARVGLTDAVRATMRLFAPALTALAAVLGVIAAAAFFSPTGFTVGGYQPFDVMLFLHGVVELLGFTVGLPMVSGWTIAVALVLVVLARAAGASRLALYRLAIVAFPLTLALSQAGNVGHPRYYLVLGVALLLMLGEMIGQSFSTQGWRRWGAGGALATITMGSLAQDIDLIRNQRGDPSAAVRAIAERAAGGATVLLDRSSGEAMLTIAAAQQRYSLTITQAPCPAQRFLLVDRWRGEAMPPAPLRCGARYTPITAAEARGLSGTHWTLYERAR
jgi:hypothetical protein